MIKRRKIAIVCFMTLLLIFSTSTAVFAEDNNASEEYKIFNSVEDAEAELDNANPIYLYL